MTEDADVGVRVPALIEWIDKDRGPGGPAAADEKSVRLLQVGFPPGKEGGESSRVEHAFSLQPIGSSGPRGQKAIEHAEGAGLEVAQDRATGGLDSARADVQVRGRGRGQGQVDRDVERFVLARGQSALQVLSVRKRPGERR